MRHSDLDEHSPVSAQWVVEAAPRLAVALLRRDFLAQPPALRTAQLARVRRLLAREVARGQASPSALAQLAPAVYGVSLADCRPPAPPRGRRRR
ncbi:hypothetical protein F8S13_22175 [Chloroflexia bacterium SDU3-3]|nr:hypothetical protein F8S13_22175 [Chloroflexia bacterium SDU3-3]